jgi:hypothetical protein
MNELDKHHLRFDRPHVYICTCGVVMNWYPDGTQELVKMPEKIKYLACGHAACAKTDTYDCIICAMEAK